MSSQKSLNPLLAFLNLYQHEQNEFIPSVHFLSPVTRLATPIFDHAHPNNFWSALNFCDHVSACKKSVYSICSFFRYCQFYSPITRLATPIFEHAHRKKFSITFNLCKMHQIDWPYSFLTMPHWKTFPSNFYFCKFVSTCKKWGSFIDLLWRDAWFKNPVIWMTESILANI